MNQLPNTPTNSIGLYHSMLQNNETSAQRNARIDIEQQQALAAKAQEDSIRLQWATSPHTQQFVKMLLDVRGSIMEECTANSQAKDSNAVMLHEAHILGRVARCITELKDYRVL